MRSVESSASTREEAIQNALKELGVEMYEVDKIDILDEGSRGLLGFGARPVKVKVTVDNLPEEPTRNRRPEPQKRENTAREERPVREQRDNRPAARDERPAREQQRDNRPARPERPARQENRDTRPERPARPEQRQERQDRPEQRQDRPARPERSERPQRPTRPERPARPEQTQDRSAPPERPTRQDRPERPARPERPRPENSERPPRPERAERRSFEEEDVAPLTDIQGKEAAALLQEIITKMGMEAGVEFLRGDDGSARLNVSAEDSAILIGRKGNNLNAMQYLINRMISRGDTNDNTERIVVDVEGYVDRRREMLTEMALDMAARAKENRRSIRMKPMSPQERRIVHVALQDDPDIRTFSLGESLYRCVVISPKDAQDDRGPRGGRGRRGGAGRGGYNRGGDGGGGDRGDNRGDNRGGNRGGFRGRRDYEPDPGQFGD